MKKKIIGYQVVSETENGQEIHPMMDASFCVYNLDQATDMLDDNSNKKTYQLLRIYEGDIEQPTLMF